MIIEQSSLLCYPGAWTAKRSDKNPWIQADLQTTHRIESVTTQGRESHDQWVKSYYVSYSQDGTNWTNISELYTGNDDRNTKKMNNLPEHIEARYIRLLPNSWKNHKSMRFDVTGCALHGKNDVNKHKFCHSNSCVSHCRCWVCSPFS